MKISNKTLGIDLGTSNSVVSIYDPIKKEVVVIENTEGKRTTPSIVAFVNDKIIVGDNAKRQLEVNPNVIVSVKRHMGSKTKFFIGTKKYMPEQISSFILAYLKKYAEEKYGEIFNKAVITVPAYFNDIQRQATKLAGELAGLKVERIINEPTAAVLAYGMNKFIKKETVLVYDLGGGTFDVSILKINKNKFEVIATAGNNKLGGDDFDNLISQLIVKRIKDETKKDISEDKVVMQRIKKASEDAKITLSEDYETTILLPFLINSNNQTEHFETTLTRMEFEDMIMPLIESTIEMIEKVLVDANMKIEDINKILLVGGSSRIPLVQELVEAALEQKPLKILNPDEVVSMGAAIQGSIIEGEIKNKSLIDITQLTIGIETFDGTTFPLIPRFTKLPTQKTQIFSTYELNQEDVLINVVQGERKFAKDNISLAKFSLEGLHPQKEKRTKIKIKFEIDVNGILNISAIDKKTGKMLNSSISNSLNHSDEELEKLFQNALEFKDQDIKQAQEVKNYYLATRLLLKLQKQIEHLKKNAKFSEELQNLKEIYSHLDKAIMKKDLEIITKILIGYKVIDEINVNNDSIPELASKN